MKYRRDPFGDFFEIQKQIDQMFERFFPETAGAVPSGSLAPEQNFWRPAMDVYETVDEFIVLLEIAGIQPEEDVEIELVKNTLIVRGIRRDRSQRRKQHYHLAEVNCGRFERAVQLPDAIDEGAEPLAHYDNGFLEIVLPKVPPPAARKIHVQVAGKPREIPIDAAEPSQELDRDTTDGSETEAE